MPPDGAVPRDQPAARDQLAARAAAPARPHVTGSSSIPQQPVALLYGPGQRIVHGNPAFVAEFGAGAVGLPAREVMLSVPARAFAVAERVLVSGRPLACWLEVGGARRRLTVAPRRDPETGEVYGVAIRLATA